MACMYPLILVSTYLANLPFRVILLNYREDGVTPFVTVWKHGLTEMKV
jgi:hypothetical protein